MVKIVKLSASYLFSLAIISSCTQKLPKDVELSLTQASFNRIEIEKVINYYQSINDSLKLKAVFFLISNMKDHYSYTYKNEKEFNDMFIRIRPLSYWKNKAILDSTIALYGNPAATAEKLYDLQNVNSKFLIENIDFAFLAWKKYPWSKNLKFQEFCEILLPYCSTSEPRSNWRKDFYIRYSILLNKSREALSAIDACTLINNNLKNGFQYNEYFEIFPGGISVENVIKSKIGTCNEMANLAIYCMRSVGLPVAYDFTPQWGNVAGGHCWNVLLNKNKENVKFMGAEASPGEQSEFWFQNREKAAKVYRILYSSNQVRDHLDSSKYNNLKSNSDPNFLDVTNEYTKTSDIKLKMASNPALNIILCVFNNSHWIKISSGRYFEKDSVLFSQMGRNIVYLPVYLKDENMDSAGYPFVLNKEGLIRELYPNYSKTQTIRITRKYTLFENIRKFANDMIG